MTELLEQLLNDPTLPETVAVLTARLNAERERRQLFYDEITTDEKVEFIHGEVIVHSPARSKHLEVTGHLAGLISTHVKTQKLGFTAAEKALCVFPRNDYEPDVVFFGREKAALIEPSTIKFPIPDFVCEVVSESTEARDRGLKFKDYAAHGVGEYWIVDAESETIEQFVLRAEGYVLESKTASGELTSRAIPGFSIPAQALFNIEIYLATLRRLLQMHE